MELYINGSKINIFKGAVIKNIVREYSKIEYKKILFGQNILVDSSGRERCVSEELISGDKFFIIPNWKA